MFLSRMWAGGAAGATRRWWGRCCSGAAVAAQAGPTWRARAGGAEALRGRCRLAPCRPGALRGRARFRAFGGCPAGGTEGTWYTPVGGMGRLAGLVGHRIPSPGRRSGCAAWWRPGAWLLHGAAGWSRGCCRRWLRAAVAAAKREVAARVAVAAVLDAAAWQGRRIRPLKGFSLECNVLSSTERLSTENQPQKPIFRAKTLHSMAKP